MNKKKALMKNTLIIFLGKLTTRMLSFFLLPLYTSYLATSEYGIVDLITTYVTLLVPLITLELEMSIFRYLVDSRNKEKDTEELVTNNFLILGSSLLIFTILYIVVTHFWEIPFRWLILIDIVICTISGNFLQVARGFGKNLDYTISCFITGIGTILFNILFIVIFPLGAKGLLWSIILANGLGELYLFFKLKLYNMIHFRFTNKKLIKNLYKYSIPLVPNSISWWIVNASDRTIISFVLGAAANGIYAVSNKFPTIISSILGAFNLSWSESAALHINSPDVNEFFSDTINATVKIFTSLGIGMLACLPFAFPILIHTKYGAAYYQIPILVLASVFNVVICLYTAIYIAKKMTKKVASTTIMGAIINILVNVLLIKFIGLYAASISTAISYFIMMLHRHFDLKKYIQITYEKGLILKTVLMFIFVTFFYYKNNLILNVFSLVVAILYAYFMNKDFLKNGKNFIFQKFIRK